MEKNYQFLKMDINKPINRKLTAMQYDNKSRYILASVFSNFIPYDLTYTTVKIYGIKGDKTVFFNNAKIVDAKAGKFEIDLTEQCLAVDGDVEIQILILGANQERLSSNSFILNVKKTIIDPVKITSQNEWGALIEGLASLAEYDIYKSNIDRHDKELKEKEKQISILSNEKVNVKWFGVVGDGVTDDTENVKKALDYAQRKKMKLFFPPGEYKCNIEMIGTDGVGLIPIEGVGKKSIIKGSLTVKGKDMTNEHRYEADSNVDVSNLCFEGDGQDYALSFNWCFNSSVKNCFIKGYNTGILFPAPTTPTHQNVSRFVIDSNEIQDCKINIKSEKSSEYVVGDITITNNLFPNLYGSKTAANTNINLSSVDGAIINSNTCFLNEFGDYNIVLDNFRFVNINSNNLFEANINSIKASNGFPLTVTGNSIDWCKQSAIYLNSVHSFNISSNSFEFKNNSELTETLGVSINNSISDDSMSIISHNTFYFPNKGVVSLNNVTTCSITGNTTNTQYGSSNEPITFANTVGNVIISSNLFKGWKKMDSSIFRKLNSGNNILYQANYSETENEQYLKGNYSPNWGEIYGTPTTLTIKNNDLLISKISGHTTINDVILPESSFPRYVTITSATNYRLTLVHSDRVILKNSVNVDITMNKLITFLLFEGKLIELSRSF